MQISLKTRPQFGTWQQQLDLFMDDQGVWRCGGTLSNADIEFATRHPILLDSHHHLTTLIVCHAHARVGHNGVRQTLTEVGSRCWIPRGRSLVCKLLYRCVICHRFEGRPPVPPPLPSFRLREAPAFTYTGVDYADPLYIKQPSRSSENKVCICLFTCCVVRAIHLEVVPDMTTQSFIRSFKHFTARRGFPRKMVSDNGRTFKAAVKLLSDIVAHPEVEEYFANNRIQWSFNLEKALWWGGIFERMVRSVKRCLRKTIERGKLTMDELVTAIVEVEMIVNSRPLTYVSTEDMREPITPSRLISGRRLMSLPDGCYNRDMSDTVSNSSDLSRRMIHLKTVLPHFLKKMEEGISSGVKEVPPYFETGVQ